MSVPWACCCDDDGDGVSVAPDVSLAGAAASPNSEACDGVERVRDEEVMAQKCRSKCGVTQVEADASVSYVKARFPARRRIQPLTPPAQLIPALRLASHFPAQAPQPACRARQKAHAKARLRRRISVRARSPKSARGAVRCSLRRARCLDRSRLSTCEPSTLTFHSVRVKSVRNSSINRGRRFAQRFGSGRLVALKQQQHRFQALRPRPAFPIRDGYADHCSRCPCVLKVCSQPSGCDANAARSSTLRAQVAACRNKYSTA